MTRYQWLVLAAAWFGWGFDVFDALLFNFVAPNTVPALLDLEHGSRAARDATVLWTGVLSSILLVGWAAGGVLFGWYADRFGRRRALFVTVALYAVGTALCAAATSMGQLIAFRVLASLGIGGEWAVGAALVAETVPENRRVFAGTLLYTASPLGLLLAGAVNYQVAGVWFAHDPANSWRYVFLCGLAPVVLAFLVRLFIHEPEAWTRARAAEPPPSPRELFAPRVRRATLIGFLLAVLSTIGGAKIATALLVLGLPIADVATVIIYRLARGRSPFKGGDRAHLHHRLLALGLTQRQVVGVFYTLCASFGIAAIGLPRVGRLFGLGAMAVVVIGILAFVLTRQRPAGNEPELTRNP